MSAIVSTERLDFMWRNIQRMADHMRLLKARVKDLQDPRQTIDQSCADTITEGLKEVVQIVNWQFAALSRRTLVVENRLGIPDDNVWCTVATGAEVHCHNMLIRDAAGGNCAPNIVVGDAEPVFNDKGTPRQGGELPVYDLHYLLQALSDGVSTRLVDGLSKISMFGAQSPPAGRNV